MFYERLSEFPGVLCDPKGMFGMTMSELSCPIATL